MAGLGKVLSLAEKLGAGKIAKAKEGADKMKSVDVPEDELSELKSVKAEKVATQSKKESLMSPGEDDWQADYIMEGLNSDPNFLENMPAEEYDDLVSYGSPRVQELLGGGGDDMFTEAGDDVFEMVKDMQPEEVAENLQFFNSYSEVDEYLQGLSAADTKKFIKTVSWEDLSLFDDFDGSIQELGPKAVPPRDKKMKGGKMSGLLIPLEGLPEDTYDNATDEEIEKNSSSDEEMEEEYVEHILDKVLSDEDLDFIEKELESNERLASLFSDIILHSSEFSGEGKVEGPGNGLSDSIPARLSDGEFVFTKKAVDELGVDKLQEMMDEAEKTFDERQGKAEGGMLTQKPEAVNNEQTKAVYSSMLSANQMPSLR